MAQTRAIDIAEEALRIVEEADKRGITLRVMGAVAVSMHLKEYHDLWESLGRKLTDMDFAGYDKQREQIENLLQWTFRYEVMKPALTPGLLLGRVVFWDASENPRMMPDGKRPLNGDIFLDGLVMNHRIDWVGRLHIDSPTIPLAELVLEKTQIVGGPKELGMGEKDAKDLTCIFLEHDVGNSDYETINAEVIAKPLREDWGFYYTVTKNLKLLKDQWLPKFDIPEEHKETVVGRVNKLLDVIEKKPKSLKWKMRAKIGTKKKWYNPVEELERAEHLERM